MAIMRTPTKLTQPGKKKTHIVAVKKSVVAAHVPQYKLEAKRYIRMIKRAQSFLNISRDFVESEIEGKDIGLVCTDAVGRPLQGAVGQNVQELLNKVLLQQEALLKYLCKEAKRDHPDMQLATEALQSLQKAKNG